MKSGAGVSRRGLLALFGGAATAAVLPKVEAVAAVVPEVAAAVIGVDPGAGSVSVFAIKGPSAWVASRSLRVGDSILHSTGEGRAFWECVAMGSDSVAYYRDADAAAYEREVRSVLEAADWVGAT